MPAWFESKVVWATALMLPFAILMPLNSFVFHRPLNNSLADVTNWNDRAELYDGPFIPLPENLVFAATQSAMMEPNGFTLALFSSPTSTTFDPIPCLIPECTLPPARIAIDTFGLIWRIQEYDFLALSALAESTRPFANLWSIAVPYTCQPSDRIILPGMAPNVTSYIYTSILAFAPGRRRLETAIKIADGRIFAQLPEEIDVFMRIALQRTYGRTWGPRIGGKGKNVIRSVMALLQ